MFTLGEHQLLDVEFVVMEWVIATGDYFDAVLELVAIKVHK
jgi:hypothetical protein